MLGLAASLAALVIAPGAFDLDGMSGGYALAMVGCVGALGLAISAAMFFRSASRLDAVIDGDVVARWRLEPGEWRRFVEVEYGLEAGEKRALWRMLAAIVMVVGLGFLLLMRDHASPGVVAWVALLLAAAFVLSRLGPEAARRRLLASGAGVLVSRRGVVVAGQFHDFAMAGTRIEEVGLAEDRKVLFLIVEYSRLTGRIREGVHLRVPVPRGDRAEGVRVADALVAARAA
jgi:hypothetical protein